jgi:hypothetical protein
MEELINNPEIMLRVGLEKEVYSKYYHDLVDFCKNKYPGRDKSIYTDYLEEHHILPKCMGGKDEDSNLVLMNYRCHVLAHCLLFLMNQDNQSLATAAWCMIYASDSNRGENDINNLILSFEKFKEELASTLRKPLVCLSLDLKIVKIYRGVLEIKVDGFSPKLMSRVIKNKEMHKGYLWERLGTIENKYPEKIDEYYKDLENGIIQTINKDKAWIKEQTMLYRSRYGRGSKGKTVVGYDDKVYCIFNNVSAAKKLGFSASIISININNKATINNGGYSWKLIRSDDDLKDISSNRKRVEEIHPKSKRVICFDKENNRIIKIYETQRDTATDGFTYTTVCAALASDSRKYCGYYWYLEYEWEDDTLLENYNKSSVLPEIIVNRPNEPIKVVQLSKDYKIINIFSSLHDAKPFDYRALSKVLKKEDRLYKGFLWFTIEEIRIKFPNILKEYEERNKSNNNIRET